MFNFEPDLETMQRERAKAKELKKSRWWHNLTQRASCYYCEKILTRAEVTMDHIVPISRGGRSTAGNLVPACKSCNEQKRSLTPVEWDDYLKRGESKDQRCESAAFAQPHEIGENK